MMQIKNSSEQNNKTAWLDLSSVSVSPKEKEKAWVSPANRLKPAKRHCFPSHDQDEVGFVVFFFATCAGMTAFIHPPNTRGWGQ